VIRFPQQFTHSLTRSPNRFHSGNLGPHTRIPTLAPTHTSQLAHLLTHSHPFAQPRPSIAPAHTPNRTHSHSHTFTQPRLSIAPTYTPHCCQTQMSKHLLWILDWRGFKQRAPSLRAHTVSLMFNKFDPAAAGAAASSIAEELRATTIHTRT
jgi:hypothetical protein